jgi:hypothetical protein
MEDTSPTMITEILEVGDDMAGEFRRISSVSKARQVATH